ncbi:putative peroxiredoxin [bacterium MnTg02]|nr:putative peroxiredoxin [bacterium MnTg02]
MSISVGDRLPEATFKILTSEGPSDITVSDVFSGKKVAFFGVPGAYTPTCHGQHVPGFINKYDSFRSNGVNEIVCVAVNDPFVLDQWAKDTGAAGKIMFLADGPADFIKAIGLDFDASAFGLGVRSKRFAMIVEDGVVKTLNVEDVPSQCEIASADSLFDGM